MTGRHASLDDSGRPPHPLWIAVAAAMGVVVLGAVGISIGDELTPYSRWNLGKEKTVPTFFSATLLVAGGICAAVAARRSLCGIRLPWLALGLLLLAMGIDEMGGAHEQLERLTGIDWQVLYAPVVLAAGVVWLLIVRQLKGAPRLMMVAGAAAWGAAQTLEALQWDGDERAAGYEPMMLTEELLEMTGSAFFLLAVYTLLREAAVRRQVSQRPPDGTAPKARFQP